MSYAQYYNPYGSFQQQQQANQNAFNAGAEAMKQIMKEQEELLKQNPTMMMNTAIYEMSIGKYEKAYERFDYLSENYNDKYSWLYKGYMNELGMGTSKSYSYAKTCYTKGAELGEQNCVVELKRINQNNYLGDEKKAILVNYFKTLNSQFNSINMGAGGIYGGGMYGGNSYNGNSSGNSSSSEYTCPTCHGTGRCTICAGRGYRIYNSRYIDCTMCNGGGACYGCHGRGSIR